MKAALRYSYVGGVFLWLLAVSLHPPWVGIYYVADFEQPDQWRANGSFGLASYNAPIWHPPLASGAVPSSVRWPWQRVAQPYCVELALGKLVLRWFVGIATIGVVVGGTARLLGQGEVDVTVNFGWWLALGELVAILSIFLISLTPLALVGSDLIVFIPLTLGALLGIWLFILDKRHSTARARINPKSFETAAFAHGARRRVSTFIPRYSLATLMLGTVVLSIFLGTLFGLPKLPYAVFEKSLAILAVLSLLAPIAMWRLPANLRWALWAFVYLWLFAGARHGIGWTEGVYLAIGSLIGAAAGLVINLAKDRRVGLDCYTEQHTAASYSWAVFGFMAGLICLVPTVPLLHTLTSFLRGPIEFVSEWHTVSRTHDRNVDMFLGFIYVGIALLGLRAYMVVRRLGWWKGEWFGVFVMGTALGVFWFCFH